MISFPRSPFRFSVLSTCLCAALVFLAGCGSETRLEDPGEVVNRAHDYVLSYKIKDARELLLLHEDLFPETEPLRPDFQYVLSLCLLHSIPPEKNLIERAEREMLELATRYPEHPRAPSAWLYVGRMRDMRDYNDDEPRLEEAREAYRKVLEVYPDRIEAGEAAARYAITFMKRTEDQREDFARGAALLAEWLDANPGSPQASSLCLFLARIYDIHLEEPRRALDYFQRADRMGFNNQGQAGAKYWRMAELARDLGDLENAILYNQRIIRDYSRSGRAYEAQLMLKEIQREHPELEVEIPTLQSFEKLEVGS